MTTLAFQEVGQLLLVSSFALINCAYKKLNIAISHLNNVKWQCELNDTVYQSATVIHSIRIRCMTRGIMQWITMHIQMLTVTRNKILIFLYICETFFLLLPTAKTDCNQFNYKQLLCMLL